MDGDLPLFCRKENEANVVEESVLGLYHRSAYLPKILCDGADDELTKIGQGFSALQSLERWLHTQAILTETGQRIRSVSMRRLFNEILRGCVRGRRRVVLRSDRFLEVVAHETHLEASVWVVHEKGETDEQCHFTLDCNSVETDLCERERKYLKT